MKKMLRSLSRSFISILLVLFVIIAAENTTFAAQENQSVNETDLADSSITIPTIIARAHVQKLGWINSSNGIVGTTEMALRLEAFQLSVSGVSELGIKYRAHVQGIGWQPYVADGVTAGTQGQSKRVEAVQLELTGQNADNYDIYYRVHVQGLGWLAWAKNGGKAGTEGYSRRLEAIEIKILPKDSSFDVGTGSAFNLKPSVSVQTHMQTYGWMSAVEAGQTAGVTGKSKRMEAIRITTAGCDMNIEYSVHVQSIGWTEYAQNGETAGTTGKSLRIEAIKIKLSGNDAENYDVYYRTHVQSLGWLDWAKNDEIAGTTGLSKRMEAIQVVLVPKGHEAPGSTSKPYVNSESLTQAQVYARAKLNQVGWDLKSAFDYAASLTYYRNVSVPASGKHLEEYAKYGFVNGRGNCYVMAAVFCRMARELGYECYLVEGYVPKTGGGITVHGWTEIVVNGKTYVCDPDFTHETKKNGYMITYGTSGTWVYQKYSRVN